MSASILFHAFSISDVLYQRTEFTGGKVLFHAEVNDRLIRCPCCRSWKVIKFGHKIRQIRLIPIGGKQIFLILTTYRVKCKNCGNIRWIDLPFVDGKSNCSKGFIRYMLMLCQKMTIAETAKLLHVSWDLVKDHHKEYLSKKYRRRDWKKIKYLGIDEFAVKKGHKYLTIAVDLETGEIVFANEGKSAATLRPLLKKLQRFGGSLEAVAVDMNPGYIQALREYLPQTAVVFDKFHLVRLFQNTLDELRKQAQRTMCVAEGNTLKGSRYLILSNFADLKEEQKHRLKELLRINEPLSVAYVLREQFNLLWDLTSKEEAERFLKAWVKDAWQSGIKIIMKLGTTIMLHRQGILNYFDHQISTAKVEGINNKIKTLKRQAYGFRDIDYFKLRLYHLNKQNYSLTG